jgi:cytochrome P450
MRLAAPAGDARIDPDSVDMIDPTWQSEGDPHAVWHSMRRYDPVRWQRVDGDLGFWSITKFDDAERVLREHASFTSERGTLLTLLGQDDPAGGKQMAATDPPRHTRMREPLQRALTAKSVEQYRGRVRQAVRMVLAPGAGGEPFDFAQAMVKLPMAVTGTMMGLPERDWPELAQLTMAAVAPDDPHYMSEPTPQATLDNAHRQLFGYFQDTVLQRRGRLSDDLISTLLTMQVDERELGIGEVLSNCYSLLLGANVTTPFVPAAVLLKLAEEPVLARDWAADPGLMSTAIPEALRWASPANHFMRYAVRDVRVRDADIRAGDAVVVWLGSANRDEEVYTEPFTFDLRRRFNRHLAFGVGAHYCIGHTVARLTLHELFEELLSNYADFELTGEPEHLLSNFVAGMKHLPLRMRPLATAARAGTAAGR